MNVIGKLKLNNMKKIIFSICFVFCILMNISCKPSTVQASNSEHSIEKIIEGRGLYVYKFTVKDHNENYHEVLICGTGWSDGGISMMEICNYKK